VAASWPGHLLNPADEGTRHNLGGDLAAHPFRGFIGPKGLYANEFPAGSYGANADFPKCEQTPGVKRHG